MVTITPSFIKSRYLACLNGKYLNFYPSKKSLIPVGNGFSPFEVRYCPALIAKKAEVSVKNQPTALPEKLSKFNPFLPYDRNLLLTEISTDYVLIFNKFCVIPEHLLIITKEFAEQDAQYTVADFEVVNGVLRDLSEMKPLAFYNSGPDAGASQRHRHFQVIPTDNIPIEEHIINDSNNDLVDEPFAIPLYSSFRHACIRAPKSVSSTWHYDSYTKLRSFCKLKSNESFNLLWTREWMLLVPRRTEFSDAGMTSINAMAFAGYFLVMDESLMEHFDVLDHLKQVTFPVIEME